jgi:hypothetical protein
VGEAGELSGSGALDVQLLAYIIRNSFLTEESLKEKRLVVFCHDILFTLGEIPSGELYQDIS